MVGNHNVLRHLVEAVRDKALLSGLKAVYNMGANGLVHVVPGQRGSGCANGVEQRNVDFRLGRTHFDPMQVLHALHRDAVGVHIPESRVNPAHHPQTSAVQQVLSQLGAHLALKKDPLDVIIVIPDKGKLNHLKIRDVVGENAGSAIGNINIAGADRLHQLSLRAQLRCGIQLHCDSATGFFLHQLRPIFHIAPECGGCSVVVAPNDVKRLTGGLAVTSRAGGAAGVRSCRLTASGRLGATGNRKEHGKGERKTKNLFDFHN